MSDLDWFRELAREFIFKGRSDSELIRQGGSVTAKNDQAELLAKFLSQRLEFRNPDTPEEDQSPVSVHRNACFGNRLVLSLFPGIGMLDSQFEVEAFAVVRGPDRLWGGDVREFHPPAGVFGGIIGGPPCQDFSAARRSPPTGNGVAMLQEFLRVVDEARPLWWLVENVPGVPDLRIDGYDVQRIDIDQSWYSGTSRLRHIQFGRHSSIIDESQPKSHRVTTASPGPSQISAGTVTRSVNSRAQQCDVAAAASESSVRPE